jgi:hypothetical protein
VLRLMIAVSLVILVVLVVMGLRLGWFGRRRW